MKIESTELHPMTSATPATQATPAATHAPAHAPSTTATGKSDFRPEDAKFTASAHVVRALYQAIGHGDPSQVMKQLAPLLTPHAMWVVPGVNALTDAGAGPVKPIPLGPDAQGTQRVAFQGETGIRDYVARLYNLSGQGANGVAEAKFHPRMLDIHSQTVLPNGNIQVLIDAEATAVRGGVALDGHEDLNRGPNHDQPDASGRIHGHGLYQLRATLTPDGSKIVSLETVPHDIKLFDGFWGAKPVPMAKP